MGRAKARLLVGKKRFNTTYALIGGQRALHNHLKDKKEESEKLYTNQQQYR